MQILSFANRISKRYASFYFSNVHVFPNPISDREEWEYYLPIFKGDEWEIIAKHLLDFNECMHQLSIVHEDVLIKMARSSLEGNAREWCRYLPRSNIYSLKEFHTAFNYSCKSMYLVDFLYDEGCK